MMSMLSLLTTADIAQASHTQAAPMNNLGMNINNVRDWSTIRSFADIMKHCRRWRKIGDWNDAGVADIDENGWPVEDAQTVVAVLDRLDGTYKLSFEGQANIDVPGARVVDKIYDEATNVTTASVIIETTSKINFFIKFTNTNDGVRNIKLMRPITCGSDQTYDESRVFTDQFLTFCRFFQVIRFMDWLATNSDKNGVKKRWQDRSLPTHCSQVFNPNYPSDPFSYQGAGACWEYIVLLANKTGIDVWLNIPDVADSSYIHSLALLLRDGNEYIGPLDADRVVYLEFSNEVWNTGFKANQRNASAARSEVNRGNSPLNFDGETDSQVWGHRRVVQKTVEISRIFRQVFGDEAMQTRIRPVIHWQGVSADQPHEMLTFLDEYYGGANPMSDWQAPHPPAYYLWGAGGTAYYHPADDATLNTMWDSKQFNVEQWRKNYKLRENAAWASAFGLHRICYEGGPDLGKVSNREVAEGAWRDPRMKEKVIEHHDYWSQFGGDLFAYFTAFGMPNWGFLQDILDIDTGSPKWDALCELAEKPRAEITFGYMPPVSLYGREFTLNSDGGMGAAGNQRSIKIRPEKWYAYSLHVSQADSFEVSVEYSADESSLLQIYLGSDLLKSVKVAGDGETHQTVPAPFYIDAQVLKTIRIRADSGAVTADKIHISKIGMTGVDEKNDGDSSWGFDLQQNYPNPFNADTKICYIVPRATHVRLEVFDIRGQLTAVLEDTEKSAGLHEYVFSGDRAASGLYYYRIEAGDFERTKKMLLLK